MEEIIKIFPAHLRSFCTACFIGGEAENRSGLRLEEIRLRINQPLQALTDVSELYWNQEDRCLKEESKGAYIVEKSDIDEVLTLMSRYSLYAFEEEIKKGFLTIQGGHRVGLAGKTICENGIVRTLRQISFLNIRIAKERIGCAKPLFPYIRNGQSIYNTVIVSPPGVGKTTMLRDLIRILSQGNAGDTEGESFPGKKIGIVDERSEIAACFLGVPQNNLGPRADVLDCCPKSEGMLMLLRSMSPEIICVDELSGQAELLAVEHILHCGCGIIGTMHGESMAALKEKPYLKKWVMEGFFERYVFLRKEHCGTRKFIVYNQNMEQLNPCDRRSDTEMGDEYAENGRN